MDQTQSYPTPSLDEYSRKRGVCILGETGTGVSSTLTSYMKADIDGGKRVVLIDPYGDLVQNLTNTHSDVKVWHVGAKESAYFIDLFDTSNDTDGFQVAEEIIDLMYMLFDPHRSGVIGPRFEHAIRNTIVALLDAGQGSFINIVKMLTDTKFLQSIIPSIKHEGVRIYFTDQLEKTSDFHKSEVLDYIVSKLSVFIEPSSFIGNITNGADRQSFTTVLATTKHSIGLDLSELRKQPAHLQTIATRLLSKQLSRVIKEQNGNLTSASLYIDEVNRFDHEHLEEIATYIRKQKMELIYTARSISLASREAQYVYLAGKSVVAYRIAPPDAEVLEAYFEGFKRPSDISAQPNFHYMARMRTAEGVRFVEG